MDNFLRRAKLSGLRQTPTLQKMISQLSGAQQPLSVQNLIANLKVNKTTVYRELKSLINRHLVSEVEFGDGKKRYELVSDHHHHLICEKCHSVEDIRFTDDLSEKEQFIKTKTKFSVQRHNLEFFGLCKRCQL